MEAVTGKKEEALMFIKEALTKDEYGHDAKLQALWKLKEIFKPPDKIFSKIRLESLLQNARMALESKAPDKDFLFKYGSNLVQFVGRDSSLDPEILYQLEYVLMELKKLDENLADTISAILWSRLETNTIVLSSISLNISKKTKEKIVLDWVEAIYEPQLEFPARMAASSPQLFQDFSAVLYQVLMRSQGHKRILEVIKSFISTVMSVCVKEGKDFLGLYPKDCCSLVSLLMVAPEIFYEDRRETVTHVNSLLSQMFLNDKNKALLLLSHYSAWVGSFTQYLKDISVL